MIFDQANKVYLKGQVFTWGIVKFDNHLNENILQFTLAVPREHEIYNTGYNSDKFNYFYCYAREGLHTMAQLNRWKRNIKKCHTIEIKGCLDNRLRPSDYSAFKAQHAKYRALNVFTSTINILDIGFTDIGKTKLPEENNKLIKRLQKDFGSETKITIDENAYGLDYFGFDKSDDLPDY